MADLRSNLWKPIDAKNTGITDKYVNQASSQLDSGYNTQLNTAQNSLKSNLSNLDASKNGINKTFDTKIQDNKNEMIKSQNAYNNAMLSRNTGRSSISTSGQAQIGAVGQRLNTETETARATALSDVDKQKAQAQLDFDNNKALLEAERLDKILALARELEDKQKAIDREEYWKQKDYELRLQQAQKSSGGGGGGYSRRYYGRSGGNPTPKNDNMKVVLTPSQMGYSQADRSNAIPYRPTTTTKKLDTTPSKFSYYSQFKPKPTTQKKSTTTQSNNYNWFQRFFGKK